MAANVQGDEGDWRVGDVVLLGVVGVKLHPANIGCHGTACQPLLLAHALISLSLMCVNTMG